MDKKQYDRERYLRNRDSEILRATVLRITTMNGPKRFAYQLKHANYKAKRRGYEPCKATPEEIELCFTGSCQICETAEADLPRKLAIDHCHKTGRFRGWLCCECNKGVGFLGDDVRGIIERLTRYEKANK